MTTDWRKLVKEVMTENGLSVRAVSSAAQVNRSSLIRFLAGREFKLSSLERVLSVMGYSVDIVRIGEPSIPSSIVGKAGDLSPEGPTQTRPRLIRPACMELGY